MPSTLKRILLAVSSAVVVLATVAGLYLWRESKRPKRVWVAYSEKYREGAGGAGDQASGETEVFAEQRISRLMSGDKGCLVLTHNRSRADYLINISVVRYLDGGKVFGDATLSIVKADGDLVVAEQFHQDAGSAEDIAQQPITAAWSTLCRAQE